MTPAQATALANPCRLATETIHPRFGYLLDECSLVLTVNSGYEWIDAGFGGPVWHASISTGSLVVNPDTLFAIAARALAGVGDASAGEWRETGTIAVHLRRRLTVAEAAHVGPVVDIRGTWEHTKRLNRVRRYLPEPMRSLPDAALV